MNQEFLFKSFPGFFFLSSNSRGKLIDIQKMTLGSRFDLNATIRVLNFISLYHRGSSFSFFVKSFSRKNYLFFEFDPHVKNLLFFFFPFSSSSD